MTMKNGACAPTGSAYPKKATELFDVSHPQATRALLGPFLSVADAKCSRTVMHSAGAVVTSSLVEHLDDLTYWHEVNNGQVFRAFADVREVAHG
ncbi:hypothetical protein SAMN05216189_104715 [Pseudomonas delhiensis]|uniref:Uncharacterized protein n=1 Tax=Pseudomonas delhiensis TaxID=366289 RepID=A0A239NCI2_9PSED|nr:hypothetical protein [Pseudomonas delhiensis]SDK68021.1 hypothetical protein SAMN05216189_104715 [Pseudomonas delhiensis]SNT52621.1 hypothetical protein SAMN06295949_14215 [Pseudomonas delhiensis]